MPTLKHRPEGKFSLRERRKVYFTCHPADFDRYFEKIAADILRTHECVIYYTEDLSAPFAEEEMETDLGSYNLYVLPVTYRLLSEPCRAMTQDLPYAKEKNIPILPFMMEGGLDSLFSLEKNFGKRQYLSPYESDPSAIGYAEKLKKYLDGVLLDDETAARIRAAFDAYIFLSYRKKDRAYANELMRLIHEKPAFRDIAVWYDEFLTPGESFEENITRVLQDSRLFALLVTPQLLEEPNFVMDTEYPAAHTAGLPILPAEMQETDRAALSGKYAGLPPCVDPHDREAFYASLAAALADLAKKENDADPTHSYLMGLAYLDGIDVEFDRARGISLLTAAAEAGLPEAMKKLYDLYDAKGEYQKTLPLAERLAAHYAKASGKEHPDTLEWRNDLACCYGNLGQFEKEFSLHEKNYAAFCRVLGEEHPNTLTSLVNLACAYGNICQLQKAKDLHEKAWRALCRVLGEEHPTTLATLDQLAGVCINLGEPQKAKDLHEKIYAVQRRNRGEEHPDTLRALAHLALAYECIGEREKAAELYEQVYHARCRTLGEEHPSATETLRLRATLYGTRGDTEKALACREKIYDTLCRTLGEEHPDTLDALENLAIAYGDMGEEQKAADLLQIKASRIMRPKP